jgi:hypothetical protein
MFDLLPKIRHIFGTKLIVMKPLHYLQIQSKLNTRLNVIVNCLEVMDIQYYFDCRTARFLSEIRKL